MNRESRASARVSIWEWCTVHHFAGRAQAVGFVSHAPIARRGGPRASQRLDRAGYGGRAGRPAGTVFLALPGGTTATIVNVG